MRFASLNVGSNGANYAAAGKAVANSAANIFNVQRKTGPDYAGLSMQAMKSAAEEKIAGIKAEQKVTQVGLSTVGDVASKKLQIEGYTKSADIKRESRKAGALGAIGKMVGAGYLASKDNTKGRERPKSDLKGLYESWKTDHDGLKDRHDSERDSLGEYKPGEFKPTDYSVGGDSGKATTGDGSLTSSAQAVAAGKGSTGGGGKYDLTKMTEIAIQAGFSPENARTMAAISMGESGGNSSIDTVQSGLDPNKSNEYSIGLAQINVQAHGDKLRRRGWTEADLRDPLKNMTIAKEVYDEVGSFSPWSVYKKGLHQQYL